VFFSDLSGYTAMNEKLDPEEVERIMSRVKAEAVKIVESHGGIVNQFVGDEVLALFGIPTAHEDDPLRAVKAAVELHAMVRHGSPEVEGRTEHPLRMHTGIHTGLVVTSQRDDRDGRYGITGDAVNTGARLKAHAEADDILVSAETQRLIAPYFATEALEPMQLKGKAQSTIPYRVLGESRIRSRFEAAEQRGFTAYTGRERELAILQVCLERALAGQGQFVTVIGEPGVGKSRLLYEFRQGVDLGGRRIIKKRCQSYGSHTPYLPFINALRRGLGLRDDDTPDRLHDTAVRNVRAIDPALGDYLPHFLHLLSIPSALYPLPDHVEGEAFRLALQEALTAMIIRSATQKPMVLILEDWHWVDEASDAALKHLLSMSSAYPLLLVVLYRPEYNATWGHLTHSTAMNLSGLTEAETGRIAGAVMGAERLPAGLEALIHERTGGNPFFVEEVCAALLEDKTVVVQGGQAVLSRPPETLDLPDTVQAVIRTRLDRLESQSQQVLRLAAVIGREFTRRILERIATCPTAAIPGPPENRRDKPF
jgi:class 3 adenylate cyclase